MNNQTGSKKCFPKGCKPATVAAPFGLNPYCPCSR